ncbi:AAA family ATPase [Crenobacter intestini]|uniref:Helicase n=1 Tax=Crenobacter intestini TaxID=2563443 RepID=A0A4T0V139_9NEIS|nr:AAA family ATPase [Crenobacter intestini]TIC85189.1 helicase [Crenobacter intestini]
MMTPDIERARSALFACDPGVPRIEWVRLLAAAKDAGLTVDDADEWSVSAANYGGRRDVEGAWRSIQPDGKVRAGTLFHVAREHGWRDDGQRIEHVRPVRPVVAEPARKAPAVSAAEVWGRCVPADAGHGYIVRKGGHPDGLGLYPASAPRLTIAGLSVAGWLVLPCRAPGGELQSLQFIPPQAGAKKLNLPGASMAGGLHVVGQLGEGPAYLCEGISAAWAVWQATGHAAVVCFGSGNVRRVAEALRQKHEGLPLVLLPDVGKETEAAAIAASLPGIGWCELPADMPSNADVGDFAAEHGADVLADLLAGVRYPEHQPDAPEVPEATPAPRYRVTSARDLLAMPPLRWRIHNVLPLEGVGAIFGASSAGKSFVALDMAASLAAGLPEWFGHKAKACDVLYLALEGAAGLRNRIAAWEAHHGLPCPSGLHFMLLSDFDLTNRADVEELVSTVAEAVGQVGVVILDTLAQSAPGRDENAPGDMGLMVRGLQALQQRLGGLVLAVHHTGKDTTRGMRGHSSLRGALDCAIEVARDGEARSWRIEKVKDSADGDAHPFKLRVIELGSDDEGEPVTSCVALPDAAPVTVQSRRKLPTKASHKAAFAKLDEMLKASPYRGRGRAPADRPCIDLGEYTEAIKPLMECTRDKDRGTYAQRAITALRDNSLMDCADGWVWML